jgi:hypothetical protein
MSCERECFNGNCGEWKYVSGAWIPGITACTNRRRKKTQSKPLPPSVLVDLTRDPDMDGTPFPYDLNAEIVEAAGGFFSLSRSKIDQYVASLKKPLRPGQTAMFQLNIHDPRYAVRRRTYEISKNKIYSVSIEMTESMPSRRSNPMDESSLQYLNDWLADFWVAHDSESDARPFVPPKADQFHSEFDPLGHAISMLYSKYDQSEIRAYEPGGFLMAHLDELRAYSLDAGLTRNFHMKGESERVNLDYPDLLFNSAGVSSRASTAVVGGPITSMNYREWLPDNTTGDTREIVHKRNFLGVHPDVFKCIVNGQGQLFRHEPENPSPTRNWIFPGLPNVDTAFDCRSFTECAVISLRSQLSSTCPNATVSVLSTRTHASIYVELGTDPAPCCVGSFIYEPQNANTYSDMTNYCEKLKLSPCPDPGAYISNRTEEQFGTGWEDNPDEMNRISSAICGCLPESNPPGSAEENMKYRCNNGTFGDWFRDNFAYGPSNDGSPGKNGPGGPNESSPSISGMPQILSCKKVKCEYGNGCVETSPFDFNGMTPYECEKYCNEHWLCSLPDTGTNPDGPYECRKVGYLTQADSEEKCKENCQRCRQGPSHDFNDCYSAGYDLLDMESCECRCGEGRSHENGVCTDSSSSSSGCLGQDGLPCYMFPCHECDDQGQCVSTCMECQECVDGSCQDRPVCAENQYLKKPECECACSVECIPPKEQTGENCDCVCISPPECSSNQVLNDQCECWCADPPDCGAGTGYNPTSCECCPLGYYWDPDSTSCMSPSSSSSYNPLPTMLNDFEIKW